VHLALFPAASAPDEKLEAEFAILIAWRERVTKALEPFRAEKRKSVDAAITLRAKTDRALLAKYAAELTDLFIVSSVTIEDGDDTVAVAPHPGPRCERCWKHYDHLAAQPPDVCERCAEALRSRS
jgi:isoleucyl-tRNA synthetase